MIAWLRQWLHRLRSFFRRAQLDHDLDAELRSHLEMAFERNLARGMSSELPPLTISCDDCSMQHTSACDDCVVTFICDRDPDDAIVIDAAEVRAVEPVVRDAVVQNESARLKALVDLAEVTAEVADADVL